MVIDVFTSGIHTSIHFNTNTDLHEIIIRERWKIQFPSLNSIGICFLSGRYELVFVLLHVTSDFFPAFSLQYC